MDNEFCDWCTKSGTVHAATVKYHDGFIGEWHICVKCHDNINNNKVDVIKSARFIKKIPFKPWQPSKN